MQRSRSALFRDYLFEVACLPPPPGRSWSTLDKEQMRAVMGEFGIARARIPAPAFNGLVVAPAGQEIVEYIGDTYQLVHTELPLEGYELLPYEALISAAGGCMFIVGLGQGLDGQFRMIASHAGRDSLIDRSRINGLPPRRFEGIVYAIVEMFRRWEIGPHRLELQGFWPIASSCFLHPLNHPKYGVPNQAMFRDIRGRYGDAAAYGVKDPVEGPCVAISTREIFLQQARDLGVQHVWCDNEMAVGGVLAHTHHPIPAMREKRNCVIIHRLA